MELLLLGVILLVTKLTTTCNTLLANQDILCTDPGNHTFEECDWDVQGWTYEQGVTSGFYFTAHYGVLKSNLFCPSREETYCLQFRYVMDMTDRYSASISVQIHHYNGINQTLWKVVNEHSSIWKNAQIPIQTKESFRIVIQSWKENGRETDYIGIGSIVYIKSSCAPFPEYAFVATTPVTATTILIYFTTTMLSSPWASEQQCSPMRNAESEGDSAAPLPAIIGSIVGALVFVIALVVLILFLKKRRERLDHNRERENTVAATSKEKDNHVKGKDIRQADNPGHIEETQYYSSISEDPQTVHFSAERTNVYSSLDMDGFTHNIYSSLHVAKK